MIIITVKQLYLNLLKKNLFTNLNPFHYRRLIIITIIIIYNTIYKKISLNRFDFFF